MSYVYLRPSQLVGFRVVGPYQESAREAWAKMFGWLDQNGLRGTVKRGYGMAFDDPRHVPAERCRYQACIDLIDEMPLSAWTEMMPQSLPGGAYVRHRHFGSHDTISNVIRDMRETWCGNHGVVLARNRPLVEIYLDDPKFCSTEKLRTDLCLPVAFAEERNVA